MALGFQILRKRQLGGSGTSGSFIRRARLVIGAGELLQVFGNASLKVGRAGQETAQAQASLSIGCGPGI